jgi:L-aspartate oxidase
MTRAVASMGPHRAVVIGSGVAGLTTALRLGNCAVVTKTELGEGSSRWAQGGIAAAVGDGDSPDQHAADTEAVGRGLSDRAAIELATAGGPDSIDWLVELGAHFDTASDGTLRLGREAGHGLHRIVHANGDATGAEIMTALRRAVRARTDIEVIEHAFAVDLVRSGDSVSGVYLLDVEGRPHVLLAPAVVLATGGIGRVYSSTTNPVESTGDGLAMALRSGATIRDPEFVQFHPTALDAHVDPLPLLSEALRGAGAHLLDAAGHRFMPAIHPDGELAPRDVVARANWRQRSDGPVYLDLRPIDDMAERFPTAMRSARRAGLDPEIEPLPVKPAQHYHMGGVQTDAHGRTSLTGLYACGEVASTGLHGANRLASNSLLEGLVFGTRVAGAIAEANFRSVPGDLVVPTEALGASLDDSGAPISALRELMWEAAGLERSGDALLAGIAQLSELRSDLVSGAVGRNLHSVAGLILETALARRESRGSHYRSDYPELDPGFAHSTSVEQAPGEAASVELADSVASVSAEVAS